MLNSSNREHEPILVWHCWQIHKRLAALKLVSLGLKFMIWNLEIQSILMYDFRIVIARSTSRVLGSISSMMYGTELESPNFSLKKSMMSLVSSITRPAGISLRTTTFFIV